MRRRGTVADDLVELVARLPWWVGVVCAIASYFVLHAVAQRPLTFDPAKPSYLGMISKGLATLGQYVLPFVLLIGALGSFVHRRRARTLAAGVAQRNDAGALNQMSWREFEMLVAEAFRQQGYGVVETGRAGADGGVDLVLSRHGEKHLVQCKQWRAYKVGVEVIRELYGLMAAQGAAGGFVVTSGTFTEESRQFAEGRNVRLVDGRALHAMLDRARTSVSASAVRSVVPPPSARAAATTDPACPRCGAPMILREAKRGSNAGSSFWGCKTYPTCKGTRPI